MAKNESKKPGVTGRKSTRKRADSLAAAQAVAAAAYREVSPPNHITLSEREMIFFDNVVSEYAKVEWSEHKLEIAAFLARHMCMMDAQQSALSIEGPIVMIESKKKNTYGTANPRLGVVNNLSSSILSLRRSLSLHARAREGEARDAVKRREKQKQTENALLNNQADDDDLIARPMMN